MVLKSELDARGTCSQEQECVKTPVRIALGAVKAEIEKAISNPNINCRQNVNFSSDSGITPSNGQIQQPDMVMDILAISKASATANGRNREPVKAEPVTSGWNDVHEDQSRRYDNFSKLSMI